MKLAALIPLLTARPTQLTMRFVAICLAYTVGRIDQPEANPAIIVAVFCGMLLLGVDWVIGSWHRAK